MADLLKKRRSALPIPREKGRVTMATFLRSSVKSREVGHGLCHHLLEKRGSGLLVLRGKGVRPWPSSSLPYSRAVEVVMAFLLKKRRSALPIPRDKGRMTMATFLVSLVKSREGGHGLCHLLREKRGTALLVLRRGR